MLRFTSLELLIIDDLGLHPEPPSAVGRIPTLAATPSQR
jgi:hypothetical protein